MERLHIMLFALVLNGSVGLFLGALIGVFLSNIFGLSDTAPLRISFGILGAIIGVFKAVNKVKNIKKL